MVKKVTFEYRRVGSDGPADVEGQVVEAVSTNPNVGFVVINKDETGPSFMAMRTWREGLLVYEPEQLGPADSLMLRKSNFMRGNPIPTIGYEHVAGRKEPCTEFFELWKAWVFDPTVQHSARCHIRTWNKRIVLPDTEQIQATEDFWQAMKIEAEKWLILADTLLPRHLAQKIHKKIPSAPDQYPSQVRLRHLPILIAQGFGNWRPPVPRPRYVEPPRLFLLPSRSIDAVTLAAS